MADNTLLSAAVGTGDTLRTEDRTTFKTPVSIIDQGAAGGAESLVDSTNPLYTQLRSEQVDDAAFTPATSRVAMAGATFDDATPDSVDEGDGGALRMSARRELYSQIRDAAGNERGANVNASNQLAVAGPVTNAGTFAVQVDGSALTALQLIDDTVFSDDAAFTVGTSKVNATGFLADETATDSVDEGDIGAARMTLDRKVQVSAELEGNSYRSSGSSLTPKFARINGSTSGDNTLVAAVASKKIRVLSLSIIAAGTVTVNFQTAVAGAYLAGPYPLIANTGMVLPFSPYGHFETVAGDLLNMELNAAIAVGGQLVYVEV